MEMAKVNFYETLKARGREVMGDNRNAMPASLDLKYREPARQGEVCNCKGKHFVMDIGLNKIIPCVCIRVGGFAEQCLRNCGLGADVDAWTFHNWVPALSPQADIIRKNVQAYASGKPLPPWIVIWSRIKGTGKTHLLKALTRHMAGEGRTIRYIVAYDLEAEIKEAIGSNSVGQAVRYFSTVPILVLDDLGTQLKSDFVESHFHALLDRRYDQGLQTVIAFNEDALATMGARLKSRLTDTLRVTTYEMEGPDVRPLLGRMMD